MTVTSSPIFHASPGARRRGRAVRAALTLPIALAAAFLAGGACGAGKRERPALVVMITVDQLRADLLDRYDSLFTGGFRRLHERGMSFQNGWVDHAVTVSHPGHATLATGLVPARHGIVDAAFYEPAQGGRRLVDALDDPQEQILKVPGRAGVSPRRFLATTLAEWILEADPDARAAAIGTGQFSSLLHAGRARAEVYWYAAAAGAYVTSTFYRRDYPGWVERFNRDVLPRYIQDSAVWENQTPPDGRRLADPDDVPYEADGVHVSFPHRFDREVPEPQRKAPAALAGWFAVTPMVDAATLALAREAVQVLELGRRGSTDYLAVVLSQADDIGHWYGPLSQEQLDNLLRLDRELGEFFKFLDGAVDNGRYVVALSSDHGAPNLPELEHDKGRPGRRVSEKEINDTLEEVAQAVAAQPGAAEAARRVVEVLERRNFVADAMTPDELLGIGESDDPFLTLHRKSYRADRVPRFPLFSFANGQSPIGETGVMVRLVEGAVIDLDPVVHGSAYEYDRRVPILFMGMGVEVGSSQAPARTVDVAPTLARLAGIKFPQGLDGKPLL